MESNSAPPRRNTFAYVGGIPLLSGDPAGLKKWDWNGQGDIHACDYYAQMAQAHPKCKYYKAAEAICRGENDVVNSATRWAMRFAWLTNSTDDSQATILEKLRGALVVADEQARKGGKVDCDTDCVKGDDIDKYHNKAFEAAGLSTFFYGGNRWPQGVYPNPVPFDPRSHPYYPDFPGGEPIYLPGAFE